MKEKIPRILIFSHEKFDTLCKAQGINDDNVENRDDLAFISIIGTDECRKYWLDEDIDHYFKKNHPNVLNLEYDDLYSDKEYEGHLFKAITDEQAMESIDFIDNNIGKTFIIHCRAGISRSQAYFRFITDHYSDLYSRDCGNSNNPCESPNLGVVEHLRNAYMKKYKIEYFK